MKRKATQELARRGVTFAFEPQVYCVDCSGTTEELFYSRHDFLRFQSEYIEEERDSGNLSKLAERKRRQVAFQRHTVKVETKRKKIDNRIRELLAESRQATAPSLDEQESYDDICFRAPPRYALFSSEQPHNTSSSTSSPCPPNLSVSATAPPSYIVHSPSTEPQRRRPSVAGAA